MIRPTITRAAAVTIAAGALLGFAGTAQATWTPAPNPAQPINRLHTEAYACDPVNGTTVHATGGKLAGYPYKADARNRLTVTVDGQPASMTFGTSYDSMQVLPYAYTPYAAHTVRIVVTAPTTPSGSFDVTKTIARCA
jgi:hypothetical protein